MRRPTHHQSGVCVCGGGVSNSRLSKSRRANKSTNVGPTEEAMNKHPNQIHVKEGRSIAKTKIKQTIPHKIMKKTKEPATAGEGFRAGHTKRARTPPQSHIRH